MCLSLPHRAEKNLLELKKEKKGKKWSLFPQSWFITRNVVKNEPEIKLNFLYNRTSVKRKVPNAKLLNANPVRSMKEQINLNGKTFMPSPTNLSK